MMSHKYNVNVTSSMTTALPQNESNCLMKPTSEFSLLHCSNLLLPFLVQTLWRHKYDSFSYH